MTSRAGHVQLQTANVSREVLPFVIGRLTFGLCSGSSFNLN